MIKLESIYDSKFYEEVVRRLAANVSIDPEEIMLEDSYITIQLHGGKVTLFLKCDTAELSEIYIDKSILNKLSEEYMPNRVYSQVSSLYSYVQEAYEIYEEFLYVLDDIEIDELDKVDESVKVEAEETYDEESEADKKLRSTGSSINELKDYFKFKVIDNYSGIATAYDNNREDEVDQYVDEFFDAFVYSKILEYEVGEDEEYDWDILIDDIMDDNRDDIEGFDSSYEDLEIQIRDDKMSELNSWYDSQRL